MNLTIFDTLRREKTPFVPHDPKRVTLYVCGPTVYNFAHVGNARPYVVFDVLYRLLRHIYGADHVLYARNITDVDDKINKKAHDEGVDISVITNRFADIFHADMAALGTLKPDLEPRVTQNMDAIVGQINALIDNGHAYVAEGHVLFDVTTYASYGALSKRSLDDMIAGARVEVAPYKKNAQDFVLWKPSKENEPRWPSPWGEGRPGWHIECSAMIEANLGLPIDIHGGGHDLIFPHHENEIAQGICAQIPKNRNEICAQIPKSEDEICAQGCGHDAQYARFWMHNGFLTMDSEKMSKSLGNVLLVHDLIKTVPAEVVRLSLLSAHYRAPLDWTDGLLEQNRKRLDGLYQTLRTFADVPVADGAIPDTILNALCDDLNTPQALAELSSLAKALETADSVDAKIAAKAALLSGGAILGLLQQDPESWFTSGADDDLTAKVEALLLARIAARAEKNWIEADRIRAELTALNIEVMDSPTGATWKTKS
jgi:cysteinyl-tRNA synthetase